MQIIENIILDYGNVLFDIDFSRLRQSFIDLGIPEVDTFYGHRAQHALFDAFDKGLITAAQFRDEIRKATGNPVLNDEAIDTAWNSLLIGVRAGHHELLHDLKKRYRTFLLSNNNEIHYAWIMAHLNREFGLKDNTGFFEKDYYSHLLRMRKPDREIFDFILNNHSLDPVRTLFVDDSPQHIETAQRLGLQAHLLEPSNSLPSLLEKLGLIKQ
ncbi:HAD family hydrolase [Parapedobacter indicus]|uniref:Putative hydrolase of the HAD superfamily n=1 Tax=Parapedobacter indicus TaxID=1477437 RepID=A0A1I3DRD5_9SPHI|nr:HAD family phosphatase [Parapedobacter indicus]PPL04803.1 putative hydrolase of the HAD superfamily [Parapedobacter indicus]SFH89118.1 putative hydrolase of the HAD superfamily [Parapedobacter indicus]